jgi:hypothetical protein
MNGKPLDEVEEQRQKNAAEMDKRVKRIRERLASGTYPMQDDNPLLHASDDEVRAYIRKRREEFEERHKNDPPKKERK